MAKYRHYLLLLTAITLFLLAGGLALAATEFVTIIDKDNAAGTDFTRMTDFESALDGDLTVATIKVFSHGGITGTIADGSSVTGQTSGATGTALHVTATQILIAAISGTFQSGEQVYQTENTNYVVTSNTGDSPIIVGEFRSSSGTADTNIVSFTGWTTSATNYIELRAHSSDPHGGSWNTNAYRLSASSNDNLGFGAGADHVRIHGLQFGGANMVGFNDVIVVSPNADNDFRFYDNIVSMGGHNDSAGASACLQLGLVAGADARKADIYNNVFFNCAAPSITMFAIWVRSGWDDVAIYNNTFSSSTIAIDINAPGTNVRLKNNIADTCKGNCYNATAGTYNTDSGFNLSSDATYASSTADFTSANPTFVSQFGPTFDLHLDSGDTAAKDLGVDLSADTYAAFSTDIDGNTRSGSWDIGADELLASNVTIAGTVYSDQGSTDINADKTVALSINGGTTLNTDLFTDETDADGAYSISVPAANLSADDKIIVFLDGETEDGSTVTVSDDNALSGLNIYQDWIIVRHDNAGSMTNALLSAADNGDTDIEYSVTGSDLTVSGNGLHIWTGDTFAPGGNITITNGGFTKSGTFTQGTATVTFDLADTGTYTITGATTFNDLTISGDSDSLAISDDLTVQDDLTISNTSASTGIVADGAETHTISVAGDIIHSGVVSLEDDLTTVLNGSATQTVTTSNTGQLGSLQVSNTSAAVVLGDDLLLQGNLTIDASAELDVTASNFNITITDGGLTKSGTFTQGTGTVTFNLANAGTYTITGATTFNDLTISGDSDSLAISDNLTVQNDLTISNTSGSTGIVADGAETHTISVAGDVIHSGTVSLEGDLTTTVNGSTTQTVTISSTGQLGDLTVSNTSAEVQLGDDLLVADDITVDANTTFDLITFGITGQVGTTFTNNGKIQLQGDQSFSNATPTNNSGSTIEYTAGSSSRAIQNWDYSSASLIISGAGTFTMSAGETVGGALTISAGTFDVSDQTLAINGNTVLSVGTLKTGTGAVTFGDGAGDSVTISSGELQVESDAASDITINAGTWTNSGGTITYNASGATTGLFSGMSTYNNLAINGSSSTFTADGDLDINGTFTLTNGTLDLNTNDPAVNIAGNITLNGGSITAGSGTVTFDGDLTYDDNVGSLNFGVIAVGTSPDTTELASDLSCTSLTINSGDRLNTNGYDIDCSGGITIAGTLDATDDGEGDDTAINLGGNWSKTGTFTVDQSTVTFDGSSGQTATSETFYNLIINNSAGSPGDSADVDAAAVTVTNTLTVTDGQFQPATLSDFKNVSIGASGILKPDASAAITVSGNWSNSGTFTANSGTVTFDGSSSQTVTADTFYNLTVDNSAGSPGDSADVDAAAATVTNALTVSDGQFQPATTATFADVTIDTDGILKPDALATITISGDWSNSGTFTANSGTVTFDGSGSQTVTADTFYNLTVDNSAGSPGDSADVDAAAVTVTNTLTVTDGQFQPATLSDFKDVSIGAGGILKPDASAAISVSGNWSNSGTFTANSGTITLDGGSQSISGNTTFYDLLKTVSAAYTLTFTNGATQTISNNLTLQGAASNLLSLRSDVTDSQWLIDPQNNRTISYVNVKDSNNSNATAIDCTGQNCTNAGNNTNWTFDPEAQASVTVTTGGGGAPGGASQPPAPPLGGFRLSINQGDAATNQQIVILNFKATNEINRMVVANSPDFADASIQNFQPKIEWNLCSKTGNILDSATSCPSGVYTVYAKFYNRYGLTSAVVTNSIILDVVPPPIQLLDQRDVYSASQNVVLRGLTDPAAAVFITWNNKHGLTHADATGNWSADLGQLAVGNTSVEIKIVDIAGNKNIQVSTLTVQARVAVQPPSTTVTPPAASTTQPPTIIEQIGEAIEDVIDVFAPPAEEVVEPEPLLIIPEEAPLVMRSGWSILPTQAIARFVFKPLPERVTLLTQKFPELESTFQSVGITRRTDLKKLDSANLVLPGITKAAGLTRADIGPSGISAFPAEAKAKIPTNIVFPKAADYRIDYNINLSFTSQGEPEQRFKTLAGAPLELVIKPEEAVDSVTGYLALKDRTQGFQTNTSPIAFFASLLATPANAAEPSTRFILDEFEYQDADADGIYTAQILSPAVKGEYEIVTVLDYINPDRDDEESSLTVLIDPEGYVYEKISGYEARISDAKVTLHWFNPTSNQYELWPAHEFQQENNQLTDQTGEYSFLVPIGQYYLKVEARGYATYRSEVFEVRAGSGIHQNIELQKKFHYLQGFLDWQTIVIIIAVLLLAYNFYRDRTREKFLPKKK